MHGTVTVDGSVAHYTPNAHGDFTGIDTFHFKANDGGHDSNVADVAVNLTNSPPAPIAQTVSTIEDASRIITLAATDVGRGSLSFKITGLPAHESLLDGQHVISASEAATGYVLNSGPGNRVWYRPDPNYNGTDAFLFNAIAGDADGDAAAAVSITVTPVNDAPVPNAPSLTTAPDGSVPVELNADGVETPAAQLRYTITSLPNHGVLAYQGTPVTIGEVFVGIPAGLLYTPGIACAASGGDAFAFSVTDGGDLSGAPALPQGAPITSSSTVRVSVAAPAPSGSVALTDGILRVFGTAKADQIVVTSNGVTMTVQMARKVIWSGSSAAVNEVRVWGLAGKDSITFTSPVVVPRLLDGGARSRSQKWPTAWTARVLATPWE